VPILEPLDELDPNQAALLAKSLPGPDGEPLNVFRTLVRVPELMRRINAMGGYFFVAGQLSVRDRELVILRTAAYAGSNYEVGQHRWLGAEAGLSMGEIAAALDPASPFVWPERERRLLGFVDELLEGDTVSSKTWHHLAPEFSETERLELLVLVGYYRMLAGVLNTVGVELDASVADVISS
jgi:4-carboxymuconolactone decarboxylase